MTDFSRAYRGLAFQFSVPLTSRASRPQFQANPTLAAGDVKVTKDFGATANITTLPTVAPAAGVFVKVPLSATEMTADEVSVSFIDAAGAEWDDLLVTLHPRLLISDGIIDRGTLTAGTVSALTLPVALTTIYVDRCWGIILTGAAAGETFIVGAYNSGTGVITPKILPGASVALTNAPGAAGYELYMLPPGVDVGQIITPGTYPATSLGYRIGTSLDALVSDAVAQATAAAAAAAAIVPGPAVD